MKRAFSSFLVVVLIFSMTMIANTSVFAAKSGDFTYSVSNSTATITGYTGKGGAVTIPSKLGGYKVTSIGMSAFSGCTRLTSIKIPNSITKITEYVFQNCTGLTSMTIPDSVKRIEGMSFSGCSGLKKVSIGSSVTYIGSNAFGGCTGLTSVTIPKSVISIDVGVFDGCSGLKQFIVDKNNNKYSSQNDVLFNSTKTSLIYYPHGKKGSYTIPNGVTNIGESAFMDCTGLTSVTIPNSVTRIEGQYNGGAFYGCTGLTKITIPDSVITIGNLAFSECTSLTSIILGSGIKSMGCEFGNGKGYDIGGGDGAFQMCTKLTSAYFLGNAPPISNSEFAQCASTFKVYYNSGKTGFTNPWHNWITEIFNPLAKDKAANVPKTQVNSKIKVNDYVSFGKYKGEPILWECVDNSNGVMLVSEYILCRKAFDAAESGTAFDNNKTIADEEKNDVGKLGSNVWSNSNIREWLNSSSQKVSYTSQPPVEGAIFLEPNPYSEEAGFLSNFTQSDREKIQAINHDGVMDTIYLLSEDELKKYFKSDTERIRKEKSGADSDYWARTPAMGNSTLVLDIYHDGSFAGYFYASFGGNGILPALNLKSDISTSGKGTIDAPYLVN